MEEFARQWKKLKNMYTRRYGRNCLKNEGDGGQL